MGGMIYIVNLINILNYLDEEEQPEVVVFYNPDVEEYISQIKYPHVTIVKWNFPGFADGYIQCHW